MLSEVDCSANGVAVRGKGEAGKIFGVVTTVVLHRETITAVLIGNMNLSMGIYERSKEGGSCSLPAAQQSIETH